MLTLVGMVGSKMLLWLGGAAAGLLGLVALMWGERRTGVVNERMREQGDRADADKKALAADNADLWVSDADVLRRLHERDERK